VRLLTTDNEEEALEIAKELDEQIYSANKMSLK